ncbi:cysteine proteinase inhibitor [Striga asiatica]|uniref:Cysteine proteinase inhibitor n=1 Tax=Striga asiatica TaxID=4170 RepID=A0A5A7R630_STRAF|nr:cysteine proteinase inhibitor [Striga asiatica]
MAFKLNALVITAEIVLVAYILLDIYASIFVDLNSTAIPEERVIRLNSTNEDPKLVKVGMFAVDEYNKMKRSNLKFQSEIKAMFSQSSYILLIDVTHETFSMSKRYVTIVHPHGDRMSLMAFEEYSESDI